MICDCGSCDCHVMQVEEIVEGSFVAEDIHLPHVYVDRVVQGRSFEKRIEVRK